MDIRNSRFPLLWVWCLLFVMSLASAYGQSNTLMGVKVPFPFSVGDKTFPAGEYTVERVDQFRGKLMIRSADGRVAKIFLTIADETGPASGDNLLVFHRYRHDDTYFLSQVWCGELRANYELLPSRAEREAAKKAPEPRYRLVSLPSHPIRRHDRN